MITSLRLSGTHKVHVNSKRNFSVGDRTFNIDKDIPIVRYAFDTYGNAEIQYIAKMMKTFEKQTHIVEVNVSTELDSVLSNLDERLPKAAKFVRANITDSIVKDGISVASDDNTLGLLQMTSGHRVDQVVLVDVSTTLDYMHAEKIIRELSKWLGISTKQFGLCNSPLSMGERACLTAVKARELMSIYGDETAPLPSANHQSMNECGCIRFLNIDCDTNEMPEKVAASTGDDSEKATRAAKKPKYNQKFSFI